MSMLPSDPPHNPAPSLSKNRQLVLVAGAAVAALVLGLGGYGLSKLFEDPPEVEAKVTPGVFKPTQNQRKNLQYVKVISRDFEDSEPVEGKIAFDDSRTTQVFSPVTGKVQTTPILVGDKVTAGQVLAVIESPEIIQASSDLATAEATAKQAENQLKLANDNLVRQQELYKVQGVALKDLKQAEQDQIAAQGARDSARIALEGARQKNGLYGKISGKSTAQIKAPVAGFVVQKLVGPGQFIQSSSGGAQTPLFVISDLSRVWMQAGVPETLSGKMRQGALVRVSVPAYPDQTFDAKLTFVAPTLDPVTRRLVVRAEIKNPNGALKPEMLASFAIATGPRHRGLGVPDSAVLFEGDTARVWVVRPDGTLTLRAITAGPSLNGIIEVKSGLRAEETVVGSGSIFIDRVAKPNG